MKNGPIIINFYQFTVIIKIDTILLGRAIIRSIVIPTPKNSINSFCLAFQIKKKHSYLPSYEALLAFLIFHSTIGARRTFFNKLQLFHVLFFFFSVGICTIQFLIFII
jgi:hypothetical protein